MTWFRVVEKLLKIQPPKSFTHYTGIQILFCLPVSQNDNNTTSMFPNHTNHKKLRFQNDGITTKPGSPQQCYLPFVVYLMSHDFWASIANVLTLYGYSYDCNNPDKSRANTEIWWFNVGQRRRRWATIEAA